MSATKTSKNRINPPARPLDDDTAARVLQEMIGLGTVHENEINRILKDGPGKRGLSPREVAIVLRVSTVLGIPAPFELPPVYALARDLIDDCQGGDSDDVSRFAGCLLAESLCVGADLAGAERESLLLSTLAAFWPDEQGIEPIDDVLAAINRRVVGQEVTVAA